MAFRIRYDNKDGYEQIPIELETKKEARLKIQELAKNGFKNFDLQKIGECLI